MKKMHRAVTWFLAAVLAVIAASPLTAGPRNKKEVPPPEGVFQVSQGMNRDYCLIEMRDDAGKMWPMFWLAHPKDTGSVDTKGSGSFTILGEGRDVQLYAGSRQEKRLGGTLSSTEKYKDRKGEEHERRIGPSIELKVTLTSPTSADMEISFNGKKASAAGTISLRPANPQGKGSVDINGSCETTYKALGLSSEDKPVTIKFYAPAR